MFALGTFMFRFFEARDAGDNVFNENNDYFLWWWCDVHHGSRTFIENAMRLRVCIPGSYESLLSLNGPREMTPNHDGDVVAAWMSHDRSTRAPQSHQKIAEHMTGQCRWSRRPFQNHCFL